MNLLAPPKKSEKTQVQYTLGLFDDLPGAPGGVRAIGGQAFVLEGFALPYIAALLPLLDSIKRRAQIRHMVTPGGFTMSVGLTNCGSLGWVSDRQGYRYSAVDPLSGEPWPALPPLMLELAREAAQKAGFEHFDPDACLINHYAPGARMSLHQDRDEKQLGEPIVSVSLGLPATFLFGGFERSDRTQRVPLVHGDVVVWGGADRLRFHGVLPIKPAEHSLLGPWRINCTFRKAGH
ncbi:DNA oxidative demethylase AlkB [Pseudomonas baltica]|uniref:DNA oxidative demethylase AlkB n=1 Tax=Pseudomonas baltica TaxID=2762576 RepID=UPI0039089D67